MDQYADKLTDGTKALLKKYPETFRVDVYKTHRTAAAPQWVYDNTFKNATARPSSTATSSRGRLRRHSVPDPEDRRRGDVEPPAALARRVVAAVDINQYLVTADGKTVLTTDGDVDQQMPYYPKDGSPSQFARAATTGSIRLRQRRPADPRRRSHRRPRRTSTPTRRRPGST